MTRLTPVITLLTSILITANAYSINGADELLNNVSSDSKEAGVENQAIQNTQNIFEGFKLKDPFSIQFFSEWRNAGKLDYELNAWFIGFLQGKYEQSAHLLTVVKNKIPSEQYSLYRAAEVYLYSKLGLNQQFLDSWIEFIDNDKLFNSKTGMTLAQYVDSVATGFFNTNSFNLSEDQIRKLVKKSSFQTPFFKYANAVINLRKGEIAYQSMIDVPSTHLLKMPLLKTVLLDLARQNKLADAGKLIKRYLEPEIENEKDPIVLGEYYINLARFLYQAGALEAAEKYYMKVPDKHPQFVQARAELMWVYLRTNENAKLRGQIVSLKSDLFEKYFTPEIYVVRSISNLKLCQYDQIEKDFNGFVSENSKWLKKITENLERETVDMKSAKKDFYFNQANERLVAIEKEITKTSELAKASIKAALPAVGEQPHWKKNINSLALHKEQVKKQRLAEYKRAWKNRKKIIAEAVKKMRFIKVEAMSQIRNLNRNNQTLGEGSISVKPKTNKDNLVFPYDGAFWPDEVLNLQAKAKSYCLQKAEL